MPEAVALFVRFFKFSLAALLGAWLAALSVVAWLVCESYAVAIDRGERATAAFAAVVEQQTGRTFQAIRLTLGAVGDAHQLSPRPVRNAPEFQQMMTRRLADMPFVRALFVLDPAGRIIHDTDYPGTPNVSLGDRPYFRAQADEADPRGTVWPPLQSRSGKGWFVPVTRPLGRLGEFEGVVVAAVQAESLEEQFRRVGLGEGYLIALFHLDGTLVAMHPRGGAEVGKDFSHLPIFSRYAQEKSGTFWTRRGPVPGMRVVSYSVVEDSPLIVHVSRSKEELLAAWRGTALAAGVAMSALTVLLGGFIAHLVGDRARRARERERRTQAEKMEALGQLTAGVTHDFGNVLHIVAVNAEMLRSRPSDSAAVKHAAEVIERAVRGGSAMLERLMTFSRRRPLAIARLKLEEWLETARPLLEQAAGPLVTLETEVKRPLPEAWCDPTQLDAAVVNLIVNARDAMAGSGRIVVRAYACDNDSGAPRAFSGSPAPFVCLVVEDNGPGMSERVRRRALEPFYTTKGEAGTGLGLSQVYGFMRQVDGDMTIDSAPGKGTSVHLFFRVADLADAARA